MTVVLVYITARDHEEALRIGSALVEERLAACVNVLGAMTSVYRWQGRIHEEQEAVLIAKTTDDLFEPLAERVRALHSYECPCIVSWPLGAGNPPYLDWIRRETTGG